MPRKVAPRRFTCLIFFILLLSSCTSPFPFLTQVQLTSNYATTETPYVTATPAPTEIPYITATPAPVLPIPANFKESPDLTALVGAGQLPPVTQRLPEHPKVVPPVEEIGKYGGTLRLAIQSTGDTEQFIRSVAYEPLVRWTRDWSGIEPNLAESYSISSNSLVYTFKLRQDLRWSDGEPFTTRDIRFWYEDVLLNPQLTPVIPTWLLSRGQVVKFEFVDDLTFTVRFLAPNGLFLQQLATPDALVITAYPAHYAQKFHQKYLIQAELDQQIQQGGYTSWTDMFIQKVGIDPLEVANFTDPERPRLSAWLIKNAYQPGAKAITWTRNPYYWKVDPQGNQLPYIDSVSFLMAQNYDEEINLTLDHQVDMQNLSRLGIDYDAFLQANEARGQSDSQYKTFKLLQSQNNLMVINLNLTHPDRVKRAIFQNKNFRVGLSYAINRQEILDLLFKGNGKPWQAAPPDNSPFYDPSMATEYTDFDPEKANQFLDTAGYPKDELGHRMGPDGRQITFTVEVADNAPLQIAMLNMVSRYLADVGINMRTRIDPVPVLKAIVESNQHDAAAWAGGGTFFNEVLLRPSNYIPNSPDAFWAIQWANWYTKSGSGAGEQPDDVTSIALGMYDRILAVQTPKEQIRMMKSILGMAKENFWTIGIALGSDTYGVVHDTIRNVPTEMPSAWIYPDPGPTNPEQYFIEQ